MRYLSLSVLLLFVGWICFTASQGDENIEEEHYKVGDRLTSDYINHTLIQTDPITKAVSIVTAPPEYVVELDENGELAFVKVPVDVQKRKEIELAINEIVKFESSIEDNIHINKHGIGELRVSHDSILSSEDRKRIQKMSKKHLISVQLRVGTKSDYLDFVTAEVCVETSIYFTFTNAYDSNVTIRKIISSNHSDEFDFLPTAYKDIVVAANSVFEFKVMFLSQYVNRYSTVISVYTSKGTVAYPLNVETSPNSYGLSPILSHMTPSSSNSLQFKFQFSNMRSSTLQILDVGTTKDFLTIGLVRPMYRSKR